MLFMLMMWFLKNKMFVQYLTYNCYLCDTCRILTFEDTKEVISSRRRRTENTMDPKKRQKKKKTKNDLQNTTQKTQDR